MEYKLNKETSYQYFVNSNKTILYLYNKDLNTIKHIYKDKWGSSDIEVLECKKNEEILKLVDLKTIISEDNNFIKTCEVISSTLDLPGYFTKEDNETLIVENILNEFVGGKVFVDSKTNNKYNHIKKSELNILELLKNECNFTYILLKNLFHNESDFMLLNFLNWLNVVSFKDTNQDIIYLFCGLNEEKQGQGAGKGVLIGYLSKMFSGLVQSVSNESYNSNFNSRLQNKKIIVFDEVNFKYLKYETLKDITGNSVLNVEYKGKESITSKNVSSWLLFTNEYDLHNKITIQDRRTFIINPNPTNGSLKRIIEEDLKLDMKSFFNKLYSEIDNFINIISLLGGIVKTPLDITSNAHINYFKNKSKVSVNDLDKLYKVLTNKEYKKRVIDIINENKEIEPNKIYIIEEIIKVLELEIMNYKTFSRLFTQLQFFGYINKNLKVNKEWEIFKEEILKLKEWEYRKVDGSKTKKMERYKDNILVKINNKNKKVNSYLRSIYGSIRLDYQEEKQYQDCLNQERLWGKN